MQVLSDKMKVATVSCKGGISVKESDNVAKAKDTFLCKGGISVKELDNVAKAKGTVKATAIYLDGREKVSKVFIDSAGGSP